MDWFFDILNMLFTFLDRVVYGLITILYQLLLYLANLDLFGMSEVASGNSDNVIVQLSSRIYAFLGIFMLFRVGFSILQYMVNPDDFSDKGKGFGKLVTNVMVVLVLIIMVPSIFEKAFDLQGIILKENVIGTLILGETTTADSLSDPTNEEMAEDLQFLIYGVFFSVNTDVDALESCSTSPILGTRAMAQNPECLDALADALADYGGEEKLGEFFSIENDGESMRDFDAFGDVVNAEVDGEEVFNYMPISIIAGGFVVVMLLSFCMDVAVRVVKLGFLEIISPIPIISYIDPKQSTKDGMLGKWARECLSTYLSLFIRLAIIYFVFFVIQLLANDILGAASDGTYLNGESPEGLMEGFVQIMIILGVLLFAKEVPKLIEKIFGIESAGNLSINPLKKISESPLASAVVGGAVGAGLSSVASGISAFQTSKANDESGLTALKRGLGGAAGGLVRGVRDGATAKGLMDVGRRSMTNAGIAARNASIARGTTARGRIAARAANMFGMPSKKETMDQSISYKEAVSKRISGINDRMEDQLAKKSDVWKGIQAERKVYEQALADRKISNATYVDFLDKAHKDEEKLKAWYYKAGGVTDENGNLIPKFADEQLAVDKKTLAEEAKDAGITLTNIDDWKKVDDQGKDIDKAIYATRADDKYRDATRYDQVVKQESGQRHMNT